MVHNSSSSHPCVTVSVFSFFLSGLDYVSHEDILPYNSTEQAPIQHELFERFLMYNPAKCKHASTVSTSAFNITLHTYFLQCPEGFYNNSHNEHTVNICHPVLLLFPLLLYHIVMNDTSL